jgi:GTP cyclohydrolase I
VTIASSHSINNGMNTGKLVNQVSSLPDRNTHNGQQVKYSPEKVEANKEKMMDAVRVMLETVGEDPEREGLLKTPKRVAEAMQFLTQGYEQSLEKLVNGAIFDEGHNEMVLVRDIDFFSLCEHHMLPFLGKAHVAYIPDGKVIGLSKIPRIVEMFARRLQVQERMTRQIAEFLQQTLHPQGVAVVVEGLHMCSAMRGVKKANARMSTSAMLGIFKENQKTRDEFMAHIARRPVAF